MADEKKVRKQYPDRDTRIAMADKKITELEALNKSRRELIEKTEAKLNERKEMLAKSEKMLASVIARRNKLIAAKERPAVGSEAAKAMKAAEKAQMDQLKAIMKEKGITIEDVIKAL